MEKNASFACLLICLCLLSSIAFAQKDFYIPKALVTPLHNEPQQLFASVGIGDGFSANLSYALSPHIAIFATGTLDKGTRKRSGFLLGDRYDIIKDDHVLTYGAGYFIKHKGRLNVLETYAGYTMNKVNNYWYFINDTELGLNYTKARYNQFFYQLNIGRKTLKHDWNFAGRFSYNSYRSMLFYDTNPNAIYEKNYYKDMHGFNFDPAVSYGHHFGFISVSLQGGISIPLSADRYTQVSTFTTYENGAQVITAQAGTATDLLLATFGRLSVEYTLNLQRQKNKKAN